MKVVINSCYGGFGLSDEAFARYLELKGITYYRYKSEFWGDNFYKVPKEEYDAINEKCKANRDYKEANDLYLSYYDIERNDETLIKVIEEMGDKANGRCAKLSIVDIPDEVSYTIEEYDGNEWIAEAHRTWS